LQEFKGKWVQYWQKLPSGLNKYLLCDPANSKKKGSDYTVLAVVGLDTLGNYYLVDMIRKRLNLHERWQHLKAMVLDHPTLQKVGYEEYGLQADRAYFDKCMRQEGVNFQIQPLGGKAVKPERIRWLQPIFAEGKFFLPFSLMQDSENLIQTFVVQEFLLFPYAPHDDMLDAISRICDPQFNASKPISIPSDRYDRKPKKSNASAWAS